MVENGLKHVSLASLNQDYDLQVKDGPHDTKCLVPHMWVVGLTRNPEGLPSIISVEHARMLSLQKMCR